MSRAQTLAALVATARITGMAGLALTAVACKRDTPAPQAAAEPAPSEVVADPGPSTEPATQPGLAPSPDLALVQDGEWTEADDAICDPTLARELGDADIDFNPRAAADLAESLSDVTRACCEQMPAVRLGAHPQRFACCAVAPPQSDDRMMACTPWGPPSPPHMVA